jgi:hypothetical protein
MKTSKIAMKRLAMIVYAPPIRIVSSALCEWLILLVLFVIFIPWICFSCLAFSNCLLRASAIRIYKSGDKGHPCLSPL